MEMVSGTKIRYLTPLKKWRLMDLNSLRLEANYPGSESGFRKYILGLEKKGLIKKFRDNHSLKNLVCLTQEGESLIGVSENFPSVSHETVDHDSRLSLLGRDFLKLDSIESVELDHELIKDRNIGQQKGWIPDGILKGKKGRSKFKVALELELTRKTRSRYLGKIQDYLSSTVYDYVLYFFHVEGVFESYRQSIIEKFGDEAFEKIMLAFNPAVFDRYFQFDETTVFFNGKEKKISEIF